MDGLTLCIQPSAGVTLGPTEIGPAQAPRPTSSTPTTTSAPASHSARSKARPGALRRIAWRSLGTVTGHRVENDPREGATTQFMRGSIGWVDQIAALPPS